MASVFFLFSFCYEEKIRKWICLKYFVIVFVLCVSCTHVYVYIVYTVYENALLFSFEY